MKRFLAICRSQAARWMAGRLAATVICLCGTRSMAASVLDDLRPLVVTKTWTEHTAEKQGDTQPREVTAEIWTAAFQRRIDETKRLEIPARPEPYYVDGPIVLPSGATIVAEPAAEIRLVPGANTCIVRNANLVGFASGPVPADSQPDTDIAIDGGIWSTTLATTPAAPQGNRRGGSGQKPPVPGVHGVILLQNVRRVSVKNVTIRQSRPFGVHLANAHEFTVENITLDRHRRDGVHVNGPASDGLIRGVRGDSHDDNVALNAWDWKHYTPSYGPIERVVVEDVTGSPDGLPSANSIRLLPGVKKFDDGTLLDCPIRDITLRRITDIKEFKCYGQPNLELGRDNDSSVGVGRLESIRFEQMTFHRPGTIEVHADTDGLVIDGVTLAFDPPPAWHLLAIGPKSATYKHNPTDTAKWTEIFSPDLDCTVRNVRVSGVRLAGSTEDLPTERLVNVIEQRLNPDYPRTTPRGGTGRGIWVR